MDLTYELRVHARDITIMDEGLGDIGNHTGDDFDTILETNRSNKIRFGENISFANLTFEAEGDNLLIYVNGDKSQGVKILYQLSANYGKIDTLEFADGTNYKLNSITNTLTLSQSDADDSVNATDLDDIIYGNGGDDTIYGNDGNDTLIGGKGNDILRGRNGNDTYIYNLGDGFDTINDLAANSYDKIVFGEGISATNLTFDYDGGLIIYINGDKSQGIKIVDQFSSYSPEYIIEKLEFADGSHIDLTKNGLTYTLNDGDNKIYQNFLKNTYIGGKGNDEYYAINSSGTTAQGGNTFIYNKGDGLDTISSMIDNGKIVFGEGISFEDITFKSVENNLYIYVNDELSQGIIINSQLLANSKKITHIEFANGSTFDLTNNGFSLSGNNADEEINGLVNNDTIHGNEGNDTIKAGAGNDIISGGKGNDILNGEAGDDSYIYNLGDGFDTITDIEGVDKIKFGDGITLDNIIFESNNGSLYLYVNADKNEGIKILNQYSYSTSSKIESLEFSDGSTLDITGGLTFRQRDCDENITTREYDEIVNAKAGNDIIFGDNGHDTLNGDDGNDIIFGGQGNDILNGGNGNDMLIGGIGYDILNGGYGDDTYIYKLGDGFNIISEVSGGGNDKIIFDEISITDLSVQQLGSDIIVTINGDKDSGIRINSHFGASSYRIEKLEFSNGILDISQYSNANQLVQAMASFGASSSVTGDITVEELNIVDNLIASNYKNVA